jgi:histidine triad (HIT) family protein
MVLTDDQAKSIKEQILKQIETFPEDKRAQIKDYISPMNNQELEDFLIKNKMLGQEGEGTEEDDTNSGKEKSSVKCIMCAISNKQIESLTLYEDKDYLAVLDINPVSPGHTLLIPKKHIKDAKDLKSSAFTLANKIGKTIMTKLSAESFQVNSSEDLGHAIINILPKYKDKKPNYERKPADKSDLQAIAIKIGQIKKKEKIIKIKTDKAEGKLKPKETAGVLGKDKPKSNLIQVSRRIP